MSDARASVSWNYSLTYLEIDIVRVTDSSFTWKDMMGMLSSIEM